MKYLSEMFYLTALSNAEIIQSVGDERMSIQHWWNDNDRGKQKISEKTL